MYTCIRNVSVVVASEGVMASTSAGLASWLGWLGWLAGPSWLAGWAGWLVSGWLVGWAGWLPWLRWLVASWAAASKIIFWTPVPTAIIF